MLTSPDTAFLLTVFNGAGPDDLTGLAQLATSRTLNAGDIYIPVGSASQKLAYIRKGLIRTWFLKKNEEEVTLMLRWEDQLVASLDSIFYRQPSRFTYQALEETTLVEIDYEQAEALITPNPRLAAIRDKLLMLMLGQAMGRIETFVLLSPEERYRRLLEDKPGIVNRVADKHLATLLGITPVSLSRIRKRLAIARKH
jgi:CRP-like cAMP-binding protein